MEQTLAVTLSQQKKWNEVLTSPRLLSIIFLGFASGLPLMLSGSTLQAWYAVSHVDIVTIGALSLVGQPYVYKFLWAPLLDRYRLPWLGRRCGWIMLLQIVLTILIAAMAFMHPDFSPWGLALLAVAVTFFSATQDTVINAYQTEMLLPSERGLGAALITVGYRVAMIVSGALALVLADYFGWRFTYLFMAFLMSLQLIVTMWSKENPPDTVTPHNLIEAIVNPFTEFFKEKYAIWVLVFLVIYKMGDYFAMSLGTTFLLRGLGFSLTDIGVMYKMVGMFGIFAGGLVGGLWIRHLSLLKALVIFGVMQTLAILPFMWLALYGKSYIVLVITVFTENFGSGLGTIAFVAFIMALCDHRFTATHYALFSALAAIGRVFVGPLAAIMVVHLGWVQFYFWSFMLGFPGILWLAMIRKHKVLLNN